MKTKMLPTLIGLALLGAAEAHAGDFPMPKAIAVDLDGDGKAETIDWAKFAETENEGDFYQVRVLGAGGALLWEGPEVADVENPLVFGNWHFGFSLPELAADIDGDGAVELVTPAPQSDISPTYYRILRWKGGRFVPARSGVLLESPKGTGRFPWSDADTWQGTWISSFQKANADGTFQVKVFEYLDGVAPRIGEAQVAGGAGGFEVRKWTVPLKAVGDVATPEPGGPGASGDGVVYRARLGRADHFNSRGERLVTVGDILRQDRANFYKGIRDEGDGPDPLFSTRSARDKMDALRPVPVGVGDAALRDAVLKGTPLVEVEVTSGALNVRLVER